MRDPTVACIMLTRDRPEFARRAIESFRAQTYKNKRLLIVNSGLSPILSERENGEFGISEPCFVGIDALTIGELRNHGCKYASHHYAESSTRPEIFAHFDDDDWSHQNRIAEQVALLEATGVDAVGYREVLFWRNPEAYLYTNHDQRYAIGASLCYWRKTWEREPFEDVARGEDGRWVKKVKCVGVTGLPPELVFKSAPGVHQESPRTCRIYSGQPSMICRIHAGNGRNYPIDDLVERSPNWQRSPQWDKSCAATMEA